MNLLDQAKLQQGVSLLRDAAVAGGNTYRDEARVFIDAVAALNRALDTARSAGWNITLTTESQDLAPGAHQAVVTGPWREVRATLTRDI